MSLTKEQVAKVARLARIKLSDDELGRMQGEINGILHWIDQLQQVKTDGVENFSDRQGRAMPEREDNVCDGDYVESVLANAPESAHNMFAVPKVVE
jgi:aspartyl-tRNA(Asn)/glutamyl-tRNA(Gln) amidotransferase subunit C